MFSCGVPREHCSGSVIKTQARVADGFKAHGTAEHAVKCAKKWAAKVNAENPGGPILLTSKPMRLKPGKSGEKSNKGGKRFIAPPPVR